MVLVVLIIRILRVNDTSVPLVQIDEQNFQCAFLLRVWQRQ